MFSNHHTMGVEETESRLDSRFRNRLRRRLYYGDSAELDSPSLPLTEFAVDYFHDSAPSKLGHVDIEAASNIVRENKVTPCSVVVSVLYANKLRQKNRKYLDTMSSSDVFFISMMMASKYMYDEGTDEEVYNDEWAATVDQDVCDVNKMEMEFLQALDWRLLVRPGEFEQALDDIEKQLAMREGLKRGWFTYAELDVLMGPDLIGSLWTAVGAECSKMMAALSAAYVTSLLSMLGSVVLASKVSAPLSTATVALMALHSSPALVANSGLAMLPGVGHCQADGILDHCRATLDPGEELSQENFSARLHADNRQVEMSEGVGFLVPGLGTLATNASRDNVPFTDGGQEAEGEQENLKAVKSLLDDETFCAGNAKGEINSELGKPRPLGSSVWSLWFIDSLLSQIWSFTTLSPQQKVVEANASDYSGNSSFTDGTSIDDIPQTAKLLEEHEVSTSETSVCCRCMGNTKLGRRGKKPRRMENNSRRCSLAQAKVSRALGKRSGAANLHPTRPGIEATSLAFNLFCSSSLMSSLIGWAHGHLGFHTPCDVTPSLESEGQAEGTDRQQESRSSCGQDCCQQNAQQSSSFNACSREVSSDVGLLSNSHISTHQSACFPSNPQLESRSPASNLVGLLRSRLKSLDRTEDPVICGDESDKGTTESNRKCHALSGPGGRGEISPVTTAGPRIEREINVSTIHIPFGFYTGVFTSLQGAQAA